MARRLRLDEAVDLFLDHAKVERGLARLTIDAYGRDLARFSAFLIARGREDADDITPADAGRLAQNSWKAIAVLPPSGEIIVSALTAPLR